eukprot:gene6615-6843_t
MRRRVATLATCSLNQWAMDFEGNLRRIQDSIVAAKQAGATYRVGPELEVCGYGCEDHYYELDTVQHSWEVLTELLRGNLTQDLLVDVGMPVIHRGQLESHALPPELADLTGQSSCPFGDGVLCLTDALLAAETCEELFTPQAPHINLALAGVEIISNGSGSHHQLRKLDTRLDLIRGATAKAGGVYVYANQQGCDGGRLYFDGCACVAVNGHLVAQGSQFSLKDVEVVTATVDLDEVVSFRAAISSLREQASVSQSPALVPVTFTLCKADRPVDLARPPKFHCPEEEIALGPACWLWDYLRRSGAGGFLLPLSGGADSSSTAAIVGSMCQLVVKAVAAGDQLVLADAQRVGQYKEDDAVDNAHDLANRLFHTVYMGTENSSADTRSRAKALAQQIGAHHLDINIDSIVGCVVQLFRSITGKTPRFRVDGGSPAENLALQNIQARLRMVMAFLLAQLLPWVRGRSGFLLVLGSANVDEALRGYLTKYDCSAADINPIGGISKGDLRRFLQWAAKHLGYPQLSEVEAAPPTAELEPLREGVKPQNDEDDMGMTYQELGTYGRLRKIVRCGPVAMFRHCCQIWREQHCPAVVADKARVQQQDQQQLLATLAAMMGQQQVKHFFKYYAINRHKATVLTPSYHAENYSPDDNRFDHRQFLYNVMWPWQFKRIDDAVAALDSGGAGSSLG